MKIYTTEITSEEIASDNPIHQRLFKAYVVAKDYIRGQVLEVGCGEGRGIDTLLPLAESFTAVDKIEPVIAGLQQRFPTGKFMAMNIPPLSGLADNTYDSIVSFQVIEHIQEDALFLKEIHRVLKPGGIALLTTPNRSMSLSRNPWHIREYLPQELANLAKKFFPQVEMKGITGNKKVMEYHEENRRSVNRIMRFDIFNLQYRLPAFMLRLPYEILNRRNRNKLQSADNTLVANIHHDDYIVVDDATNALDLLLIVRK
ncbi:class I SAM-dependent methyltransferase [Parachryseolinea silvisoli]|jgi:SAM-dependent methyltransferase|uniref:class I SAM-dependent methyltransferase n=1 Tax=Parachryseolinea silvisoli TaxID=2873601 RepID=UPI0022658986|nr:class I SAM-dependent methyltransferase [Parachryseolinea silvisoli]MCD9019582.1 class I SAM-dependent methyltransferase [Parachryseolinea silvisoli]